MPPSERVLQSEFGWITLAAPGETIGVREVLRVDGRVVAPAPRLQSLLRHRGSDASHQMDAILAESATWNLGTAHRNINFPTFGPRIRAAHRGARHEVGRLASW